WTGPTSGVCTCADGTYLSGTQCLPCPASGVCPCSDGTYLSGTQCLPCPGSCLKCSSATVCTDCISSWHFTVKGATSGQCSDRCPKNCIACTYDLECGTCQSNYYLTTDLLCGLCNK